MDLRRPNPAPRPNRRLSAPYQYGHPWTWRESLAVFVVVSGLFVLAALIVQVIR